MIPKHYRTEAAKTEFLRDALLGFLWARKALIQTAKNDFQFQQLLVRFHSAITMYNTIQEKSDSEKVLKQILQENSKCTDKFLHISEIINIFQKQITPTIIVKTVEVPIISCESALSLRN